MPDYEKAAELLIEKVDKLREENKQLRSAMLNMCFCKRHICKRCAYVEKMSDRCINERMRDEIFRKLSKPL